MIITGKRKSKGVDSNVDMSYQKRIAYDHCGLSNQDPRSSSRYGKEPAGGKHYTKKRKQEDHKGIVINIITRTWYSLKY